MDEEITKQLDEKESKDLLRVKNNLIRETNRETPFRI